MKIPLTVLVLFFSLFIISYQKVDAAASPLTKVIMTSGSASERDGVVYVAQDQGFFRKYGLDLSFVQVRNGPVAMSALARAKRNFTGDPFRELTLGRLPKALIWFLSPGLST